MIRHAVLRRKCLLQFILAGLTVVSILAASLPQPELSGCEAQIQTIHRAFYERYDHGRSDWDALEPLVEQAHRCFGDARIAAHAALFNYETSILVRQRHFAEAEAVFMQFFADYAEVATPEVMAKMHLRRGYVYERLGWTAARLVEYARAAALAEELPPPSAASTLRYAGEQYLSVNDLETAHRYLAVAESLLVAIYEENPAAHGPELGIVRLRRARVLLEEGVRGVRPEREAAEAAVPLLEGALRLIPAAPAHAFDRVGALLNLAEVYWARGEPQAAFVPLAEARHLSPWFRDTYPQTVAHLARKEGNTHYLLGHYDDARRAYQTALEIARAAGEREEETRALIGLGEVAEAEAAGSEAGDLRHAEHYFRQAAALAEEARRTYGMQNWSASAWERTQEPYSHLTRVLLRQHRPAEAFLTLDATRARYLLDLRDAARLRATLDLRAAARLDSLTSALNDVRYALRDPSSLPMPERADLEMSQVTLQQQVDAVTGIAEAEKDALTLEAVQRALRPRGQVLITYFLDDDLPTAFVVRADTFAAVPLAARNDALQAQVRALGGWWAENGDPRVGIRLTPLHALYQTLYAPVAALVPEGAPLVVIPDGPLAQVPFGLLTEADRGAYAYADAPYLLRRHAITTELAAALLVVPDPPRALPLDLLALGRSRFDDVESDAAPTAPSFSGPATRQGLGNLPNVGTELARIGRRIPNGRIALDDEATETLLDAHLAEVRLLHLASHTLVNPQLPLYSRIVLSDDPDSPDDDGTLYLYELQGRSLDADLVTLSGCGTAQGRRRVGEGMIGLQYAFRAAGAHATLATLWQVDDAATVEVMDRFYEHLRRGLPKDEALQQAQLGYLEAHRDDGRKASPFFWAAPVLYGSTAPVAFEQAGPSAALWVPAGLLLLLAGVGLPRVVRRVHARRSERA